MKSTGSFLILSLLLTPCSLLAQSPSTWSRIQQKVLDQNCITCHVAGSFFATQSGLTLTSDSSYIKLVNARPKNYAALADSLVRVSAIGGLVGLAKSYIWEKLDASNQAHYYTAHPNYGALMPLGLPYLTNGELAFIKSWILAGAPEAGVVADTNLFNDTTRYTPPTFTPLAPPATGMQLHLGPFNVSPNQLYDRELFYYVPLTHTRDLFISRMELSMRPGSHHFLMYTFQPGTPSFLMPTPFTYRDVRDSLGTYNPTVLLQMGYHNFFFGSQTPYLNYYFPPGVALRLPAQTGLDLNSHYVNRSAAPTTGEVYANIYTVDSSAVQRVAEVLFLNNQNITLPPNQITTIASSFTFPETRQIIYFWAHAHEHMVEFRVERIGGPNNGQLVYYSNNWQDPPILYLTPPLTVNAGDGLKLITTYNNATNQTIRFGLLSTDEMQILFGGYYTGSVVSVDEPRQNISRFELAPNYPNPFNPTTTIQFSLPHASNVTLKIFNIIGQEVATLVSERLPSGQHKREWNAASQPSGMYFYRLEAGEFVETKKLVLMK